MLHAHFCSLVLEGVGWLMFLILILLTLVFLFFILVWKVLTDCQSACLNLTCFSLQEELGSARILSFNHSISPTRIKGWALLGGSKLWSGGLQCYVPKRYGILSAFMTFDSSHLTFNIWPYLLKSVHLKLYPEFNQKSQLKYFTFSLPCSL